MLVILDTHPIQYHVPIYQLLSERGSVPFEVWYLTSHGVVPTLDVDFGVEFKWDINILGGYQYSFPIDRHPQNMASFWKIRLPASFRDRLVDGSITAIFISGWNVFAFWQALYYANKFDIPIWIRGDSNDIKVDPIIKGFVKRIILGQFFKKVSKFLYVGEANRRLYKKYGVEDPRFAYAPHAVDNKRFADQASKLNLKKNSIRENWRIPEDAFCILFAGKFTHKKRPLDIIKAVSILVKNNSYKKYHILFVGSGELRQVLKENSNICFDVENPELETINFDNSHLRPNASFVGFLNQKEISLGYVAADVLVLPSNCEETWGLVVNEALASGLPAIVSKDCGCSEDLASPLNQMLTYDSSNIDNLVNSLTYIENNQIPKYKIESHISNYNFEITVDTICDLWKNLKN